jgi:hypothetical protein
LTTALTRIKLKGCSRFARQARAVLLTVFHIKRLQPIEVAAVKVTKEKS